VNVNLGRLGAAAFLARRRFGNWGVPLAIASLAPLRRSDTIFVPRALRPDLPPRFAIRRGTSDEEVFEAIFLRGAYDFPELRRLNITSILDAGAHCGLATVFLHSMFPQAHIVAIEPAEDNFRQLRRNVALASIERSVTCVHGAVWPRHEPVSIIDPTVDSWAYRTTAAGRAPTSTADAVTGRTPDELAAMAPSGTFDLIKLDIEGSERELFTDPSALGAFSQARAVLIELHDRIVEGSSAAFYRAIVDRPFNQYTREDAALIVFDSQR
jgi:FkbM family methyltransferase